MPPVTIGKKMRKKSILVIDDEPRIVEILTRFLVLQGFDAKKAYDGTRGLSMIKRGSPVDLILLDERMPGMRGAAFFEQLKELGIDVPVVVLTGSINASELDHPRKKIYKHLLIKPVRLSELVKLINRILASKRKKRAGRS